MPPPRSGGYIPLTGNDMKFKTKEEKAKFHEERNRDFAAALLHKTLLQQVSSQVVIRKFLPCLSATRLLKMRDLIDSLLETRAEQKAYWQQNRQ